LKRSGLDARFFVATLIAVVTVSALANIAMGYAVKFGEALTVSNVGKLDIVQAVVSLAATGLISLVTFALAELVGQDVTAAVKVSSKSVKPAAVTVPQVTTDVLNTEALTAFPMPIEQARAVKGDSDAQQKAAAIDALVTYLTSNPDATVSELARVIGKSRPTVYNYLDELETAGKLHRNGQITVLDSVQG
jgi:DNA-binding transcriptional ArsR family regulator